MVPRRGWGFCCYDVRGFGDSEGQFTDYTLSDWIADARSSWACIQAEPKMTIVGNSFGSWIAWLVAQECSTVEELDLDRAGVQHDGRAGQNHLQGTTP